MKKENFWEKHSLKIFLGILVILSVVIFCLINRDINRIKQFEKDKENIEANIKNYNKKADVILQKDSINQSDILMFQSEGIDLKKELHDFESEKEEEIKDLYMHTMKYWAYLIALLVSIVVFIGIKWNFHEYISKKLASLFDDNKEDFEKLIRDKSWEFSLIKKAHIMVADLNPNDENEYIQKVLKWFGDKGNKDSVVYLKNINFNNPQSIIDKLTPKKNKFNILLVENSGYNDVFFNNKKPDDKDTDEQRQSKETHNNRVKQNLNNAKELAVRLREDIFLVYYGPRDKGNFPSFGFDEQIKAIKKIKDNDKIKKISQDIMNRISFANAPSKLYVSLVETLKYMDILNDDINA